MAVKFTNNAKTTLASGITSTATSATVVDGSVFPTLGAGEYFYCTFDDTTNNEIVKVTARSSNTLTIVRGVDNTTARAFSSGDAAELRATAGLLTDIQENIAAKSANQTVYNTTTASSATDYDIGIDPSVEANAMVFLNGVMQHHDTFSFSGSTLTFDTAPSDGMALEVIVDNLINLQSSNLTVDTFTAADVGGNPQTDFTLSDSPAAETNLIVFVDGVFQDQDAYTISTNVLTMTDGVIADRVVTVYVINPVNIGTPSDGTVTSAKLSGNITMPANLTVTGDVAFDSPTFVVDNANSRVGIGTAAPTTLLDIVGDVKMSANLTVERKLTISGDDNNNRLIFKPMGANTYQYVLDNYVTDNDFRIFREATDGSAGQTLFQIDSGGKIKVGNTGNGVTSNAGFDMSPYNSALKLPTGTTAQRPTAENGMIRYNSTEAEVEAYANGNWVPLAVVFTASGGTETTSGGYKYHTFNSSETFTVSAGTKTVEYLIVGGGGGGGSRHAGGGGAGGYRSGTFSASPQSYTVTVGAAGSGGVANSSLASNGGDSSISSVATSTGGGAGGQYSESGSVRQDNGSNGGSGGGASNAVGTTSTGGSGTSGQGNDGGDVTSNGSNWAGAGGGGASAAGGNGSSGSGNSGGAGGAGSQWSNGTYYAGGGGGGGSQNTATGGAGGTGGGGAGGGGDDVSQTGLDGTAGTANTGGGGGGSRNNDGANGGSGIVIIRYQL
jgi:hypothetical protein